MTTTLAFVVIALVALAEALLFWLYEITKWQLFLKGRIDSITYLCPVEGFCFTLLTPMFGCLVLAFISGNHDGAMDMRGLWALPGFFLWALLLRKPMNLWRQHLVKTIKLTSERAQELARTGAIADFLVSGGLG